MTNDKSVAQESRTPECDAAEFYAGDLDGGQEAIPAELGRSLEHRLTEALREAKNAELCRKLHSIRADEAERRLAAQQAPVLEECRKSRLFAQFLDQGFWHAHHVDLVWRHDGKEVREEADWLKNLWYLLRGKP